MTCDEYREWVSWELDGELENGRSEELAQHLASCAECARAAEEMRSAHADIARAMEGARAPASLQGRILAAAREAAESDRRATRARGRSFLRVAVSAAAVLLIGFGVAAVSIDRMQASASDVSVYGTSTYEADAPAALRVVVRDSRTGGGLAGSTVTMKLAGIALGTFQSDAAGAVNGACRMPDLPEGDYPLEVTVTSPLGTDRVERRVRLARTQRVLLTSDKPLYQPGQVIRLRMLALHAMTMKPAAGKTALFVVTDPRGNRIFKREATTSEFGIASVDVPLADEITLGRYGVSCEVERVKSEKTVEVKRYVLPKFKVAVELDKPYYRPGETIEGTARADYFFTKPVEKGRVRVTLSAFHVDSLREFATATGETDASGVFTFRTKVPDVLFGIDLLRGSALVRVEAEVLDGAGHAERGARSVSVSQQTLRVDALPADGGFVEGVEKRLLLITTYPDGTAAPKVKVALRQGTWANDVTTDEAGVAESVIPEMAAVHLRAEDAKGNATSATVEPNRFRKARALIVRTDKPSYRGGESMKVTVLTHRRSGAMYLDVVKAGQTALTQALEIKGGRAEATIDLPAELFGTLQVAAYSVEPDGTLAREARVVHVNLPEQLKIRPKLARETFRPGEEVAVDFEVIDGAGKPVRGALGVSVVDEALFHLSESRPGLEAVYFAIVEDLLKPTVDAHANAVFAMSAHDVVGDARALRIRTAVAQDVDHGHTRICHRLATDKIEAVEALKRKYKEWLGTAFAAFIGLAGLGMLAFLYGVPLYGAIKEGRDLTRVAMWAGFLYALIIVSVALMNRGSVEFPAIVGAGIASVGIVGLVAAARWWGEHGRPGIGAVAVILPLLGLPLLIVPTMSAGRSVRYKLAGMDETVGAAPAMEVARAGGARAIPEMDQPRDTASTKGAPSVRVREYFPETLYWNPQIITDDQGRARLTFAGADSITNWKMALSAVSAKGQLGGASHDLRVFQDFFVDIDFPVALTQGDIVSVPVAVYNYLAEPQTVRLAVDREDWFELLDDAERSVEMKANEVKGVRFLVRVAKVGNRRLTVKAFGSKGLNDAVRRAVEIRPNGREVELSVSERLSTGTSRGRFTIPADAIEGGTAVVVRLSPAGMGEVVRGLESMVRLPSG